MTKITACSSQKTNDRQKRYIQNHRQMTHTSPELLTQFTYITTGTEILYQCTHACAHTHYIVHTAKVEMS